MQLAIPSAPRDVKLKQVPGAFRRLAVVAAASLVATAGLWAVAGLTGRWLSSERDFFERAVEVDGLVADVQLPPFEQRGSEDATVTVLYELDGRPQTASGVAVESERAEGMGRGARLTLLVDPRAPTKPRERFTAEGKGGRRTLALGALGLGLVVSLLLGAREWRRAIRREVEPLRTGMLVWLTPDGELPDTKNELVFPASYWKQDVQQKVTARARPGRAPVRNGDKLLAAVLPSQPAWVRVIDEDLAQTLGWFRDSGPGRL